MEALQSDRTEGHSGGRNTSVVITRSVVPEMFYCWRGTWWGPIYGYCRPSPLVNEAALTGESAVNKDAALLLGRSALPGCLNMVFSGTTVVAGGPGSGVATAMNTCWGRLPT